MKAGRRTCDACTPDLSSCTQTIYLYLFLNAKSCTAHPVQPNTKQMLLGVWPGLRYAPAQVPKPQVINSKHNSTQVNRLKAQRKRTAYLSPVPHRGQVRPAHLKPWVTVPHQPDHLRTGKPAWSVGGGKAGDLPASTLAAGVGWSEGPSVLESCLLLVPA